MTKRQLEILQHALGVDEFGRGAQYRNHFCAGGDDEAVCRELVALGYMQQHPTTALFPYFNCSVTDAGKRAMSAESPEPPKLTRGQRQYEKWLAVADCYPDWKFRDWLKAQKAVQP